MAVQKPYTLNGEADAGMVEKIDAMFRQLYALLGGGGHEMLSETHTDSKVDGENPKVVRGDLIVGRATPQGADRIKWQRLAVGADATLLRSDGVDPQWDKVQLDTDVAEILPVANGGTGVATLTENAVLLGNGTDPITEVSGLGSDGQVLTSQGPGLPPVWEPQVTDDQTDFVVMSAGGVGATAPDPLHDGQGNFIYVPYEP